MAVGKQPDFQFPTSIVDIYGDDAEKIFGENYMIILKNLAEHERALEDRLLHPEISASLAGALVASESTPWYPKRGSHVTEFHALLGTAGSSSTVVVLKKNGTTIATITLGSGVTVGTPQYLDVLWANDSDILTFEVTTAGTAAENLTCIARFI